MPSSDVDVMVVGSVVFAKVVEAFMPLQARLGRAVNPVVMSAKEFRAKREARDRFVTRVIKEPKIFVVGGEDDLGKPAQDRPARTPRARR
jgi:hypothetical protein